MTTCSEPHQKQQKDSQWELDFLLGNRGVHFTFTDESWLLWVWFFKFRAEIKTNVSEMCPLHDTTSLCPTGMQLPAHYRAPPSNPSLKGASNEVMIRGGPAVTCTIRIECQVPNLLVPWEWTGSKALWEVTGTYSSIEPVLTLVPLGFYFHFSSQDRQITS